MSFPVNPLDKFESCSYHFLLYAANNTETLSTLTDSSANGGFDSFYNRGSGSLIRTGPKPTDVVTVVLNTMIDSVYTIDSVNYTTNYGGNPSDGALIIAAPIKMVVREPGGVNFMNDLQSIFNDTLKTSANGAVFGLKIFFVGQTPDGNIDQSVHTRDVYMQMIDLTATLDESGGIYSIAFVCIGGGPVNDTFETRYVKRNRALAITGNKLTDMVKAFEKKLNDELEEEYSKVKASGGRKVRYQFNTPTSWDNYVIDSATNDNYDEQKFPKGKNPNVEVVKQSGIQSIAAQQTDHQITRLNTQKAQYQSQMENNNAKITKLQALNKSSDVDSQIQTLQTNNAELAKNITSITDQVEKLKTQRDAQQANVGQQSATPSSNQDAKASDHIDPPAPTKNGKTYFNMSVHMTIYQTIKEMLKRCPNIAKRVADKAKIEGSKITFNDMEFFRIISNVTSDSETVTYHVDINDLFVPKISSDNNGKTTIGTKEITKDKYDEIGYVYDYIFSGKNSDIMHFDMKLIHGALMLNRNINRSSSDGQKPASATDPVNGKAPADSDQKNPSVNDINTYSPVYTSTMSTDNQKGNTAVQSDTKMSETQIFMQALSQFAALSSIDTSVTIRGNPDLMDSIIPTIYPHDNAAYEQKMKQINDEARKVFEGAAGSKTIKDYKLNFPLLVKINIYSKSKDSTPENPKYDVPFWYTGWYMGTKIENIFSGGSFIQKLYLTAMDVSSGSKVATNGT